MAHSSNQHPYTIFLGLVVLGIALTQTTLVPGEEHSAHPLPDGCDVLYKCLSPDAQRIAFVGSYVADGGTTQHGLFVVELQTQEVRRLLDTAVKTLPAWSSDSSCLAIGNSPGYGNRYPLVIVDVASGELIKTGVQGVGAVWSPDGRLIAFSTEIVLGGNWLQGVRPEPGRIAQRLDQRFLLRGLPRRGPAAANPSKIACCFFGCLCRDGNRLDKNRC